MANWERGKGTKPVNNFRFYFTFVEPIKNLFYCFGHRIVTSACFCHQYHYLFRFHMRVFSSIIHLYLDLIMKFDKFKIIFTFAVLGVLDTAYLTWEHFTNTVPPCSNNIFIDCGKVLNSQYSVVFGIPLALTGLVHYLVLMGFVVLSIKAGKKIFRYFSLLQTFFVLLV